MDRKHYIMSSAILLLCMIGMLYWHWNTVVANARYASSGNNPGIESDGVSRVANLPLEDTAVPITGVVVDEKEQGIPGTTVTLECESIRTSAVTDKEGRFTCTLPMGRVDSESILLVDYVAESSGYMSATGKFKVDVDRPEDQHVFLIPLAGSISGVLLDTQGKRCSGYAIGLHAPGKMVIHGAGFFESRQWNATLSEADGRFKLDDVMRGVYALDVGFSEGSYIDLLGTASPEVTLLPGQELEGIVLVIPASGIGGIVVDENAMPLSGAVIEVIDTIFNRKAITGTNGTFEFCHLSGSSEQYRGEVALLGYETLDSEVIFMRDVLDHVVVMKQVSSFVKPVTLIVLDGTTDSPIPDSEVSMQGDEWISTNGKPVKMDLPWDDSRLGGYQCYVLAQAPGFLNGKLVFRVDEVEDGEQLPVYLYREGHFDVSVKIAPELQATLLSHGWNADISTDLYASCADLVGQAVSVRKQAYDRFTILAGPGQVVRCDLNMHNMTTEPNASQQSIYVTTDLYYDRDFNGPEAAIMVGGTASLRISLQGLQKAVLTRDSPTNVLSLHNGLRGHIVKEVRMSETNNNSCVFSYLCADRYVLECTYVDSDRNRKTFSESVNVSDEEMHLEYMNP